MLIEILTISSAIFGIIWFLYHFLVEKRKQKSQFELKDVSTLDMSQFLSVMSRIDGLISDIGEEKALDSLIKTLLYDNDVFDKITRDDEKREKLIQILHKTKYKGLGHEPYQILSSDNLDLLRNEGGLRYCKSVLRDKICRKCTADCNIFTCKTLIQFWKLCLLEEYGHMGFDVNRELVSEGFAEDLEVQNDPDYINPSGRYSQWLSDKYKSIAREVSGMYKQTF